MWISLRVTIHFYRGDHSRYPWRTSFPVRHRLEPSEASERWREAVCSIGCEITRRRMLRTIVVPQYQSYVSREKLFLIVLEPCRECEGLEFFDRLLVAFILYFFEWR